MRASAYPHSPPPGYRGAGVLLHVPAGAATAQSAQWVPGPGAELFSVAARELGGLPFIAENLGVTPDVVRLRDDLDVPGTRVLQFAFDGDRTNPLLPHSYPPNVVVNPGTHDNPTTLGWYDGLPEEARGRLWSYLRRPPGESREAAPALLGPFGTWLVGYAV